MKKMNERGSILLVFLLSLPFLILIATYYMRLSLTSYQVATQDQLHSQAQLAADAGAACPADGAGRCCAAAVDE